MHIVKTETVSVGTPDKSQQAEVFYLKTANNGIIAVTRLAPNPATKEQYANSKNANTPLILVHGMFSNRRFWLSEKRIGLAAKLSDLGYDCFILERRGIGRSSKQDYKTASLMQCIKYDLKAVQELALAENPQPAFWIAHSFGGVLTAAATAQKHVDTAKIRALVNFSSQLTVGKHMLNFPFSLITIAIAKSLGFFPSKALQLGPENEPPETAIDCTRLVAAAKNRGKNDYWQGFDNIKAPVLAFASEGDNIDPHQGCKQLLDKMGSVDKTFILLGKKHGHLQDYSHAGMVVSKDAIQEVWPLLFKWLEQH